MKVLDRKQGTAARTRIDQILDAGSFMEIGESISARLTDFYAPGEVEESDGVITGYGTIDGNLVYIFSQDGEVMGGTFGEMHGKKIISLYRRAIKAKAPVIGLLDCSGFRIEEGLDGLDKFGALYAVQAEASGVIPQIMVVCGRCGGGISFSAHMANFVLLDTDHGDLFVNPGSLQEKVDGAIVEQREFVDIEQPWDELVETIHQLITGLPASCKGLPPVAEFTDDLNRSCDRIASVSGDVKEMLRDLSDDGFVLELRSSYGRDMFTGFIRIGGEFVGVFGNNRAGGKYITADGCEKASSLIETCNEFNIPILSITDTDGFKAEGRQEKYLPKYAGRLIRALSIVKAPKIGLISGRVMGSAYSLMNSKGMGADMVFMWDSATANIIEPGQSMEIIYARELAQGTMSQEDLAARQAEYEEVHSSAKALARHGYVDKVIAPQDTRKYLAGALEIFSTTDLD